MASTHMRRMGASETDWQEETPHHGSSPAVSWSLRFVDVGIAASLTVTPFVMGGRSPAGQLVFTCLAFWTFVWWTIHHALGRGDCRWHGTIAFWPLIIAVAFLALQIVPLPPSLLSALSPGIGDLLPLWASQPDSQATLGIWQTISLTPDISRLSLTLLVSGVLLFVVTVQRIQHVSDVERIVRWVAISVSVMAGFGIIQFLASNGKFFWIYESPYCNTTDCVKGAFTNRNHFAQYMALGFGALLWWTTLDLPKRSHRRGTSPGFGHAYRKIPLEAALKFLLIPLCILATVMSFSRGGTLAFVACGACAVFLLWWAGKLSWKSSVLLVACSLFTCISLAIYGYDGLASRFASDHTQASLGGRSRIWLAAREGLSDYPATGTGLSSHEFVYPMYLEPERGDENLRYTHAENGYVQVALETGIVGLGLTLAFMAICFVWCASTLRHPLESRIILCFVAVLPALIANAVHSAVDFVWYVPGCMAVVAILAGCACRLHQLTRKEDEAASRVQFPRAVWAGLSLLILVAASITVPDLWRAFRSEAPWHRYLRLSRSLAELDHAPEYSDVWERTEPRRLTLVAMEKELSAALAARPDWARAHAAKAGLHLDLFNEYQLTADNSFDLRQIRETVLNGGFESNDAAREWLSRAVGEHRSHLDAALKHAHRAVALGPLQGDVYALLAQLSFLEGSSAPTKRDYISQAYRVRPYDGEVLFAAGEEAVLANQPELAVKYWKRSFHCGWQAQQRLVDMLAGQIPAQRLFEMFQPDADAAYQIARHYGREDLKPELNVVLESLARVAEAEATTALDKSEATRYWIMAASAHGRLDDLLRQKRCLEQAVTSTGLDYSSRYLLGKCHLALGEYADAEQHLRWCAQRRKDDQVVQRLLEEAVRERIATRDGASPMKEARASSAGARR